MKIDHWGWAMFSAIVAGIQVGLAAQSVAWGLAAWGCIIAIRNAVMSGYAEGRTRYELPLIKIQKDIMDKEKP